jgi:VCBS repeat protein
MLTRALLSRGLPFAAALAAVLTSHAANAAASAGAAPLPLRVALESAIPESASAVLGADFDGDGSGDIVAVTAGGDVYLALGAGGGDLASWSWQLVASVPLEIGNPYYGDLRAADVDGDGLLDLLIYGDGQALGTCEAAVVANLGAGNFATAARLPVVTPASDDVVFGCTGAELADFDGDGDLDVALSYAYEPVDWFNGLLGAVNVFLGTGGGELGAPTQYPLASDPAPYVSFAMTSGDFDGDGHLDLGFGSEVRYLSGPVAWRVEALRGDGRGGFGPGAVRAFDCTYCELMFARAADFNGDGRDDLLLPPTNPESYPSEYPVLLFEGEQGGTFGAPRELVQQVGTVGVEARDVTGDALADVVLLGQGDHVTMLEGLGDGRFGSPQRFVAGRDIASGSLADLDGDGLAELVLLGKDPLATDPVLGIARGASAGGFALPRASLTSGYVGMLASPADFDGDGNEDVLAIDYGQLELMLGTGDGRFVLGASTPTDVSPWPMPVADLNGDGRLDLVQAAGEGFAVALGLPDGHFAPTPPLSEQRDTQAAALGDLDGDGHPDLVAYGWPRETIDVYLSDGALGFTRAAALETTEYVSQLALADLDSDGALDLFAGASGQKPVPDGAPPDPLVSRVWLGDGHGGFTSGTALALQGASFRLADVDGDGALDVLGTDAICFGDGSGQFAPAAPLPSAGAGQIELADLDGDGLLDLLFLQGGLMMARGAAGGVFEPSQRLAGASGWQSFIAGRFTGSSQPDLLAVHAFRAADDQEGLELIVAENATIASDACGQRHRRRPPASREDVTAVVQQSVVAP